MNNQLVSSTETLMGLKGSPAHLTEGQKGTAGLDYNSRSYKESYFLFPQKYNCHNLSIGTQVKPNDLTHKTAHNS